MFAAIVLDNFRLQAAMRHRADLNLKAVALIDDTTKKTIITELTDFAISQGVRVGQSSSQGVALCPFLTLLTRVPKDETTAEDILLEIAFSCTPDVELTETGCCTLDMRKVPIKSDWETICNGLIQKFKLLNFNAKIGVGNNPDLAYLAAKQAATYTYVEKPEKFLANIPISKINQESDIQDLLNSWGVYTIAQLIQIPRGDITDRLGLKAKKLWDLASGKAWRVLNIRKQKEILVEKFDFEDDVENLAQIEFPTQRLLRMLLYRLEVINRVASIMTLKFYLLDKSVHKRIFKLALPTNDVGVLTRILYTYLENLQIEQPLTGMSLEFEPSTKNHQQFTLFDTVVKDEFKFNETISKLRAIEGVLHAAVARRADSYKPDSYNLLEPNFHKAEEQGEMRPGLGIGIALKRYRSPLPIKVKVLNLMPVSINSEKVSGTITDRRGPYRRCGNEWDEKTWNIEEWDVEIEGLNIFNIFEDVGEKDKWYLGGCYDSNLC